MNHRLRYLERPSIFLASPSDVKYLREMTLRLHASLVGDPPPSHAVAMYTWEEQVNLGPYDDRLAAQMQIPSPDDPLCEGVIALFGEWIGRELPRDYSIDHLNILDVQDEGLKYRLVFPWVEGAEDSGGFSLTGSTYEVLTTLAASKRQLTGQVDHAPPLLILFFGPNDVAEHEHAPDGAWGHFRYRNYVNETWRRKRPERDARLDSIDHQLKQLQNFYQYLDYCRGNLTKTVDDEDEAEKQILHFLEPILRQHMNVQDVDPFKGLGIFDVKDKSVFFGRDKEINAALERIQKLWQTDALHLHWVRGPSGSGKSSFMRAGLFGRIEGRIFSETTRYIKLIVRTNNLINNGLTSEKSALHWPLRKLFGYCFAKINNIAPEDTMLGEVLQRFDEVDQNHLDWALEILRDALATKPANETRHRRFVLGLDQFEEAVDRLGDQLHKKAWFELITFVLQLAKEDNVMIIATMRDDRSDALKHHSALEENYTKTSIATPELQLPTGENMAEIIRKPFSFVHDIVLEKNLIETLIKHVQTFQKSGRTGSTIGSYLPLISLTLHRLYNEVALPLIEDYRNFGTQVYIEKKNGSDVPKKQLDDLGFGKAADKTAPKQGSAVLTVKIAEDYNGKNYLDVAGAIETLAEEAVEATKATAGLNWDDLEIAAVLRRLVSWADSSTGQSFSLPAADWPKPGVARQLIDAMKARRLIVDEEHGRIRLIHEAVIENWKAAKEWLQYELPLLNDLPALLSVGRKWVIDDVPERVLDGAEYIHMDSSLRLLALWYELIEHVDRDDDPDGWGLLRDFCLALLDKHGKPADYVKETPQNPPLIMLAVAYQRIDIVRRMLKEVPKAASLTRSDGRSSVFSPAFHGNTELVELLISNGADGDAPDKKGWRPIHVAAVSGALEVAELLKQNGARFDGKGAPNSTSPLQIAAENGHVNLIHFFVAQAGVDLEAADKNGSTAVFRAARKNQVDALQVLLKLGAQYDKTLGAGKAEDFGWTSLHLAARDGAADSVIVLLEAGMPGDQSLANGTTALHLAASRGHNQTVRILVKWFADNGRTVDLPCYDNWKLTSEVKAKIAEYTNTASRKENNADFDITPLHQAVKFGNVEVVKILLKYGANPDRVNGAGCTALHIAARNDRPEMVPVLLKEKPDTSIYDASGRAPLHAAISAKKWSVARALIAEGISADQLGKLLLVMGREMMLTPLQRAVMYKEHEAINFLLRWGSDVNMPGPLGRTALHIAASQGYTEAVKLLRSGGAKMEAVDEEGLTPLHLAARRGDAATISALVDGLTGTTGEDCNDH